MSHGSNVHNQGIAHLAYRLGGFAFCKTRTGHIIVTPENTMGYQVCKRCAAKLEKMRAVTARNELRKTATR